MIFESRFTVFKVLSIHVTSLVLYTMNQKKQDTKLLAITSLNINRFSKFFSVADLAVNLQQIHI